LLFDPKKFCPYVAPSESPLVETLKRARTMVADGWCRETGSNAQGGVCAQVALGRAMGLSHRDFLTGKAEPVFEVFRRAIGGTDIIEWNEHPQRSQSDVVAAFDRAIDLARKDI